MSPQSGNGSQGDAWGGRGSPPDVGEWFRQGKVQFGRMLPGGSTRGVLIIALLVLAGVGAWSAYYMVPSDSVAVVQRFGKYLKEVPPGLHFKLPLGIDRATIVPVKRQLKQEFGFTTPGATDPYQSPRGGERETKLETEMVTGDLNAALSACTVLSHTAVMARALGIPAVLSLAPIPFGRLDGRRMMIDGNQGRIYINPSCDVVDAFQQRIGEQQARSERLTALRDLPAESPDGVRLPLYANIGLASDLAVARNSGAEGVGLYRTEYLFLLREAFPLEEE